MSAALAATHSRLRGAWLKVATCSAPEMARAFSGVHRVRAFTGAADRAGRSCSGNSHPSGSPLVTSPLSFTKRRRTRTKADYEALVRIWSVD